MKKLLLLFLNSALLILNCNAQWTSDPTINTAISNESPGVFEQIIADGSGGYIIVWVDHRNDERSIYAQRINALGVPQWTANGVVICNETGDVNDPHLVSDGSGGAIIVWDDNRNLDSHVYAQRINASGVVQWAANGVAIESDDPSYHGTNTGNEIISDGSGGAIISWRRNTDIEVNHIHVQRINSAGVPQWQENGIPMTNIDTWGGEAHYAKLLSDGQGGAIVSWGDNRNNAARIYAQYINAAGVIQWATNGLPICPDTEDQFAQVSITDGSGGAIIIWNDTREASSPRIYAQRINSNGVLQWDPSGILISSYILYDDPDYVIETDGSGGAIIAWTKSTINNDRDIYAQRINSNGVLWSANGVIICAANNIQDVAKITIDGSGGAIIAWRDYRTGNSRGYVQKINASGVVQWPVNGIVFSYDNSDGVGDSDIITDGSGGAVIAVQANHNQIYGIYAQNVCSDGSLGTCQTVGVKEEQNSTLTFFPNPATTQLTISGYTPAYLKLCNTLGQTVAEATNTLPSREGTKGCVIDISSLPQGLYVLQLFDAKGGLVKAEKVVKK